MNIGDVAQFSGLTPKTIRYYESRGLIRPLRDTNGYRAYRNSDAQKLRFLARARKLGFSLSECQRLLSDFERETRSDGQVIETFTEHLACLEQQLGELQRARDTIAELVHCDRADGEIADGLISYLTDNH